LHVYDDQGEHLRQIKVHGLKGVIEPSQFDSPGLPLAGVDWFE